MDSARCESAAPGSDPMEVDQQGDSNLDVLRKHTVESLICWLARRCNKRLRDAATEEKRELYMDRMQLLKQLLAEVRRNPADEVREEAYLVVQDMMDLSSDEDSPRRSMTPEEISEQIDMVGQAYQVVDSITTNYEQPIMKHPFQ